MIKKLILFAAVLSCGPAWAAVVPVSTGTARDEAIEQKREEMEKEIQAKIEEIDRQIDSLAKKSEQTETRVKGEIKDKVERLRAMKPVLSKKLAAVNMNLQDLKEDLSGMMAELKDIFRQIESAPDKKE
jgi:septal ring factor EnvC (AmiA/AmiB activator)